MHKLARCLTRKKRFRFFDTLAKMELKTLSDTLSDVQAEALVFMVT